MDKPSSEPLAQRVAKALLKEDGASMSLDMQIESVDAGKATLTMQVRADMVNGHATCHGGFIFTLADSAFAFACNSGNHRTVAAGCQIDYVRPALLGDRLRAEAIERAAGGRLGVYDVHVSNQRGETIALFRGKSCRISGVVVDEPLDAP
jgi:acyl-CoA thioesterase